jgi:hypothetical protein
MTEKELEAVLKTLQTRTGKDGWAEAADGSPLTLYVSHAGGTLTVTRVEGVKVDGDVVYARTAKKDLFGVSRASVFGVSADGVTQGQPSRRPAGFG